MTTSTSKEQEPVRFSDQELQLLQLLADAVDSSPNGRKGVAYEIQSKYYTFSRELNPYDNSAKLGFITVVRIMMKTRNLSVLFALNHLFGRMASENLVQQYANEHPCTLTTQLYSAVTAFANACDTLPSSQLQPFVDEVMRLLQLRLAAARQMEDYGEYSDINFSMAGNAAAEGIEPEVPKGSRAWLGWCWKKARRA